MGTWAMLEVVLGAELWGLEMSPPRFLLFTYQSAPAKRKKSADSGTFARVLQLACHGYQSRLSDNGFELLLAQVG